MAESDVELYEVIQSGDSIDTQNRKLDRQIQFLDNIETKMLGDKREIDILKGQIKELKEQKDTLLEMFEKETKSKLTLEIKLEQLESLNAQLREDLEDIIEVAQIKLVVSSF